MSIYNTKSDNVDFKHPQYAENFNQALKVYNVFNGVDTAKQYLQRTYKESDESYEARQELATLKNFVKRATEAFVGMIYRKPVQVVGFSDAVTDVTKFIDKKSNMNKFSRDLTTSLIRDGKVFLSVDTPIGGEGNPYMSILDRLSVINWRKNEQGEYTMLVYTEQVEEDFGDFGLELVQQWRVFRDNGTVELWREDKVTAAHYIYNVIETEFDYIPIIDISLDDIPPLYDIARLTISHMSRTSFKNKYLDMAAVPIPIIWDTSGGDDNGGTKPAYVIGVDEAFVFSGTKDESDFQWRELTGSSISALQDDLAVIEEDITSGVIRASQSDNSTMKTATQAFYEAAESSNRVTVIANAVEIGLNKAMLMIADMMDEPVESIARVIVNKDFNAITQNTDNLRLLWEVYLGGALSTETFLKSMESFEVIDIGSVEDEIKRIDKDDFQPESKGGEEKSITDENMDNRTTSALKGDKDEEE